MTGMYVASNTQALGAQIQLQRNVNSLGDVLTRLSTGLRINSGKDDPAGLIASELLKSDIAATKQAIQNTQRANSVIAVADSALGQISSLLNDIRTLVNASANTGAMTPDQINANQLQVDASIDSIDRISKTTNFQGQNLLDGSMDFSTAGVNAKSKQIDDLNIYSANFGSNPVVDVEMDVKALGEKAQLFFDKTGVSEDVYVEIGGSGGKQAMKFSAGQSVADIAKQINTYTDSTGVRAVVGQEATQGQLLVTSAGMNNDINLKAINAGFDFGNYAVKFTAGSAAGPNVVITEPVAGKTGVIDIQLQMQPWQAASATVDESQLGIYSTKFTTGGGSAATDILTVTSTNGTKVSALKFIPSNGTPNKSVNATTPVAIDLDSNGVLNIEYYSDAAGAKWSDIVAAINKMDGITAVQTKVDGAALSTAEQGAFVNATNSAAIVKNGGTLSGTDTKTNNAINIQANVNGAQMNGTDIVYVKNSLTSTNTVDGNGAVTQAGNTAVLQTTKAQAASISMKAANSNDELTITANETGSKWNGVTVTYTRANTAGVGGAAATYDANTRTLTITGSGAATTSAEIQDAVSKTGFFTATATIGTANTKSDATTSQLGAVNGTGVVGVATAGIVGADAGDYIVYDMTANNATKQVIDGATYVQSAQRASVTIENTNKGAGTNYMTFTATEATAATNGMYIKFEDNNGTAAGSEKYKNNVLATFNADKNELHIIGDLANVTYSQLIDAVSKATDGKVQLTVSANPNGSGNIASGTTKVGLGIVSDSVASDGTVGGSKIFQLGGGQNTNYFQKAIASTSNTGSQVYSSTIGTDHGAIIVNAIADSNKNAAFFPEGVATTTANMAIASINGDSSNVAFASSAVDSNGSGAIFSTTDPDTIRAFVGAMQGGSSGFVSAMTANDVIDFINSDPRLRDMFTAERAVGNDGTGYVTLFQEVAYYNIEDINSESALQFLGPKNSPDIELRIDKQVIYNSNGTYSYKNVANSPLYITWEDDPVVKADTSLTATNKNAAFSITALQAGAEYSDVAVQFIRQDNSTFAEKGNYATYEQGPTNAVAYCSINSADTGTNEEVGKFILTATGKGDNYNNVQIKAQIDNTQGEAAKAFYDANTKTLMITLNDSNVTLSQAMAAIEKDGTFTADFDYSFNANPHGDPGETTFASILGTSQNYNPVSIGNTGVTGGHTGGVIKVYLGGASITAQDAMNAINNSDATKGLFSAGYYLGSDGSGNIDFRSDTLTNVPGDCNPSTDFRMVTGLEGKCPSVTEGRMVIHLATDEFGNSITTARDLVNYFETLTAEETRGISVSMIRPTGTDNVSDLWCIDDWGKGILQETGEYDDCYNYYPNALHFISANQDEVFDYAHGQVTAVNGQEASYTLTALNAGPEFDGVTLRYSDISSDATMKEYVDYNSNDRILTIYIREGSTTANQVKQLIETSDATRSLFKVDLADGAGNGLVTTKDDAVSLKGGTRLVGDAGGAWMLGNADDDPHSLTLESVETGKGQKVSVHVIDGTFQVKNANGVVTDTALGKDAEVTLNGQKMTAQGNKVSINNSMLSLDATLNSSVKAGDKINFTITGGGATFQLGPDVVSNQQIRVSIPNVSSSHLGGVSGKLYQLRSGENADLSTDTKLADKIVQEAISSIAVTRGRLGALQRSTLEPNQAVLEDTVEQLAAAEAVISNADFAEESSKLTRDQILVQSGTQVLTLANQFPQYAAQLIRS